jgi:hypothetical protein
MLVSARYRITPGKTTDFQNLVKSDFPPVYQKAKVGLIVNREGDQEAGTSIRACAFLGFRATWAAGRS